MSTPQGTLVLSQLFNLDLKSWKCFFRKTNLIRLRHIRRRPNTEYPVKTFIPFHFPPISHRLNANANLLLSPRIRGRYLDLSLR